MFINQIMFVTPAFNRDPALILTQSLFEEIQYGNLDSTNHESPERFCRHY